MAPDLATATSTRVVPAMACPRTEQGQGQHCTESRHTTDGQKPFMLRRH